MLSRLPELCLIFYLAETGSTNSRESLRAKIFDDNKEQVVLCVGDANMFLCKLCAAMQ